MRRLFAFHCPRLTADRSSPVESLEPRQLLAAAAEAADPLAASVGEGGTATTITRFVLVNAVTNADIQVLTPGANVRLPALPTRDLNIRAETSGPAGSVRLVLDVGEPRVENVTPYAVFGDAAGDYFGGTLPVGARTITATPFGGPNASGPAGTTASMEFNLIERAIIGFVLVNADTNADIGPLVQGSTLNLASLPRNLNVRAVTNGEPVGSVRFELDGTLARTENAAPFAIFGDNSGDYLAGTFRNGSRLFRASPFAGGNGTGLEGVGLAVSFNVVGAARQAPTLPRPAGLFGAWSTIGDRPTATSVDVVDSD